MLRHWRTALALAGLSCLLAATGLAIAQSRVSPGKNATAATAAKTAPGKNAPASGPRPAASLSQPRGLTLSQCLDGSASMDDCEGLLAGMQTGDPDRNDLILALIGAAMDTDQPERAFAYADMVADPAIAAGVRCEVRVAFRRDLDHARVLCTEAMASEPAAVGLRAEVHLMAGRWQDAWQDFDTAYRLGGEPAALFMRGLAAAGAGRMGEAVRDMGEAETAAPGLTDRLQEKGYTLVAVASGQPLVTPDAFAALSADIPAPPPLRPPGGPGPGPEPEPSPGPAMASAPLAVPLIIRFAPDEPRGDLAPLDPAQTRYCDEALSTLIADADNWTGATEEKRLRLYAMQRTLFAGRCAGHRDAARLVDEARTEIAIAAAATARLTTDAKDTTPDAINCVEPMAPGDARNPTGSAALSNACDFAVSVAYCNVSPAPGSWADVFACGRDLALAIDIIPAKGATPAVFGREVQHFACRLPAGPVLTYQARTGLDGFCK